MLFVFTLYLLLVKMGAPWFPTDNVMSLALAAKGKLDIRQVDMFIADTRRGVWSGSATHRFLFRFTALSKEKGWIYKGHSH